ncbi:MAG TPA: polynucleotide kinase-phosphatase, partial [Ktedonobacteraceae bacterium]
TQDAFEILHYVAAKRLARGRVTVIDATNVQADEARKPLINLAREYHCPAIAIVFNLPIDICHERNKQRPDRNFGPHVVRNQTIQMRKSLRNLKTEGFRDTYILHSPEEVDSVEIGYTRLWPNLKHEHGPFDIIGDIHGCFDELAILLQQLGYQITPPTEEQPAYKVTPPEGRRVLFLGDLVDRGPRIPDVLRLVMDMVADGLAFCVPGNHEQKLLRKLNGSDVQIKYGLAESLSQLAEQPPAFTQRVKKFLDSLVSHYVLDDGKLVIAHAGMKETMQGRASRAVRAFALYGETTGETDEFGLPIRYNWAAEYRGQAMVVYGHTPIMTPEWLNNTINIDTGCVFGGQLTALRYPEKELVSVPAAATYSEPVRPLQPLATATNTLSTQQQYDDVLDLEDVSGKRIITTSLQRQIIIREENSIAALEVMSRFATNPRWLIYLPPTMSPSETSNEDGLLEHPAEAFAYYRSAGIAQVICEEKHMGSRAVVIVCRDEEAARKHFGVVNEGAGICYTRTGRRFFDDRSLETAFLDRVRTALDASDFWQRFQTSWVCLDCELLPWSVKAQSLLLHQYAAVGAASTGSLAEASQLLQQAKARGLAIDELASDYQHRHALATRYTEAYRRYCWPVDTIDDLKLAPFHVMATQGQTYFDRDHTWHMQTLAEICQTDPHFLLATPYQVIDVNDPGSVTTGIHWWEHLTGQGGEGMVVKPRQFLATGQHGIVQPAVKCRGPEYLRIIYGPEYDQPANIVRLRKRGLSAKRTLAMREFALGVEALKRFVLGEPLRKVHECVFGVLALESEPVDPRL